MPARRQPNVFSGGIAGLVEGVGKSQRRLTGLGAVFAMEGELHDRGQVKARVAYGFGAVVDVSVRDIEIHQQLSNDMPMSSSPLVSASESSP